MPYNSLARELKVDRSTLRASDPHLYAQIAQASVEQMGHNQTTRRNECIIFASRVVEELLEKGLTLTLRNAADLTGRSWHPGQPESIALLVIRQRLGDARAAIPTGASRLGKGYLADICAAADAIKSRTGGNSCNTNGFSAVG